VTVSKAKGDAETVRRIRSAVPVNLLYATAWAITTLAAIHVLITVVLIMGTDDLKIEQYGRALGASIILSYPPLMYAGGAILGRRASGALFLLAFLACTFGMAVLFSNSPLVFALIAP